MKPSVDTRANSIIYKNICHPEILKYSYSGSGGVCLLDFIKKYDRIFTKKYKIKDHLWNENFEQIALTIHCYKYNDFAWSEDTFIFLNLKTKFKIQPYEK
jgi:hypothetical protein